MREADWQFLISLCDTTVQHEYARRGDATPAPPPQARLGAAQPLKRTVCVAGEEPAPPAAALVEAAEYRWRGEQMPGPVVYPRVDAAAGAPTLPCPPAEVAFALMIGLPGAGATGAEGCSGSPTGTTDARPQPPTAAFTPGQFTFTAGLFTPTHLALRHKLDATVEAFLQRMREQVNAEAAAQTAAPARAAITTADSHTQDAVARVTVQAHGAGATSMAGVDEAEAAACATDADSAAAKPPLEAQATAAPLEALGGAAARTAEAFATAGPAVQAAEAEAAQAGEDAAKGEVGEEEEESAEAEAETVRDIAAAADGAETRPAGAAAAAWWSVIPPPPAHDNTAGGPPPGNTAWGPLPSDTARGPSLIDTAWEPPSNDTAWGALPNDPAQGPLGINSCGGLPPCLHSFLSASAPSPAVSPTCTIPRVEAAIGSVAIPRPAPYSQPLPGSPPPTPEPPSPLPSWPFEELIPQPVPQLIAMLGLSPRPTPFPAPPALLPGIALPAKPFSTAEQDWAAPPRPPPPPTTHALPPTTPALPPTTHALPSTTPALPSTTPALPTTIPALPPSVGLPVMPLSPREKDWAAQQEVASLMALLDSALAAHAS